MTPLTLDVARYEQAKAVDSFVLSGFALDARQRVDLDLRRVHILSPDARLVVGTATGDVPMEAPDLLLLSGTVIGQPDSWVFLSLTPHGSNGYLELDGETYVVSSGPSGPAQTTVIYNTAAVSPDSIALHDLPCGTDMLDQMAEAEIEVGTSGNEGVAGLRGAVPCGVAEVAVETDWEFTANRFAGDTVASAAYALSLMAAVSEIYDRDVEVQLNVSFLRVWSSNNDPWNTNDAFGLLSQFASYWNGTQGGISRHVAHFLSGRSLSGAGGVAYLDGLCAPNTGYGLSGYINGFFPYPLQDNHWQNWDVMVVAHELGHNFGAPHTHSMNPQIDGCGTGDCSVTPNGTIMSYCHTCPGGMTNILLQFHPRIVFERIAPFIEFEAQCDLTSYSPIITYQTPDTDACVGDAFGIFVAAEGGSLQYQWRHDGVDIPGGTNAWYVFDPVTLGDAGVYELFVSNHCGNITSAPLTLTVSEWCPAEIQSAQGCVGHGAAGDFCLDYDANNIEPRSGPMTVVFELDIPVEPTISASVICAEQVYGGTITSSVLNGTTVEVTLDPLPDGDCCTVSLGGSVVDGVDVRPLAGDVNRNGTVNATDKNLVKGAINTAPVTGTN
ncbi:MAG: hypothetical protein GY778_09720, partial [bacterium]|nr:hypothetical protein [bacterium]